MSAETFYGILGLGAVTLIGLSGVVIGSSLTLIAMLLNEYQRRKTMYPLSMDGEYSSHAKRKL